MQENLRKESFRNRGSKQHSKEKGNQYIEQAHLLLALLRQQDGLAGELWKSMKADERLRCPALKGP